MYVLPESLTSLISIDLFFISLWTACLANKIEKASGVLIERHFKIGSGESLTNGKTHAVDLCGKYEVILYACGFFH
jgi:hypothetical protein